jgi:hypothetical protein
LVLVAQGFIGGKKERFSLEGCRTGFCIGTGPVSDGIVEIDPLVLYLPHGDRRPIGFGAAEKGGWARGCSDLGHDLARERVTVRVEARGAQADEHVARALRAERREDARALNGTDGESCEVVVIAVVHGGHLGRLAADERAARLAAALGDAADDGSGGGDVEVPACVVVEEEERLRALQKGRRGGGAHL